MRSGGGALNDSHLDTAAAQARPECVCDETSIRNCSLHANPSCPTCGCPLDVDGGTSLYWFDVAATAEAGEVELERISAERNRLAAALKAEQHAHTETASEWHARFVKADQDRMALASHREKLVEALKQIRDYDQHERGPKWALATLKAIAADALSPTEQPGISSGAIPPYDGGGDAE